MNATLLTLGFVLASLPAPAAPPSSLHILAGSERVEFWRSDRAPARWDGPVAAVANAFAWQEARPGLEHAEAGLHVNRGLLRLRVIAVRIDPARFTFSLQQRLAANRMSGEWSIRDAPADAAFAVNAGQFEETGPWGWLVVDGREQRYPGRGPLSMAVTADANGAIGWVPDASVIRTRDRAFGTGGPRDRPRLAFQSYPLLLSGDGGVPAALRDPSGTLLDLTHRDTRLAVGRLPDGRLLFVMTRFAGAGRLLERLPAGLTTPEMAALMGALGARPALMLDGGLSAQMLLRDTAGVTREWAGGRRVPLALVAHQRER